MLANMRTRINALNYSGLSLVTRVAGLSQLACLTRVRRLVRKSRRWTDGETMVCPLILSVLSEIKYRVVVSS